MDMKYNMKLQLFNGKAAWVTPGTTLYISGNLKKQA